MSVHIVADATRSWRRLSAVDFCRTAESRGYGVWIVVATVEWRRLSAVDSRRTAEILCHDNQKEC
jgi:hypothetical protein